MNKRLKIPLELSERLRRSRRILELTQVEVSNRARVSQKVVWGMEKPKSHLNGSFEKLSNVVEALGGRISVWLPGEPLPAPIDYVPEDEESEA